MSTNTMTRSDSTPCTTRTTWPAPSVRQCSVPARPARPAPSVRQHGATARLTRRGRWALTLLILGALLGLSLALGSVSAATGERGTARITEKVVVDQGDTLWGIATAVGGPGETRAVMYEIEKLNHLESSALVEGQVLLVPAP